jgi:uncharacterized protein (TIGR02284 family)
MSNKTVDVLNILVEINNDRIEGYETASSETNDNDLKFLFAQLAATSEKCRAELAKEVQLMGGKPEEGTRNTGKFFRVWMDVKAALAINDRKAIFESCEFGEDAAIRAYENVLKNKREDLTPKQIQMIQEQYDSIKSEHDLIKKLRDVLTKEKV